MTFSLAGVNPVPVLRDSMWALIWASVKELTSDTESSKRCNMAAVGGGGPATLGGGGGMTLGTAPPLPAGKGLLAIPPRNGCCWSWAGGGKGRRGRKPWLLGSCWAGTHPCDSSLIIGPSFVMATRCCCPPPLGDTPLSPPPPPTPSIPPCLFTTTCPGKVARPCCCRSSCCCCCCWCCRSCCLVSPTPPPTTCNWSAIAGSITCCCCCCCCWI